MRVWSSYTGVEMFQIPLENPGVALGFSNDTTSLVTCDSAGRISIWDISAMSTPVNYVEFDELTRISKFTSSGDLLIVSDANRVLDPERQRSIHSEITLARQSRP